MSKCKEVPLSGNGKKTTPEDVVFYSKIKEAVITLVDRLYHTLSKIQNRFKEKS